MQEEHRKAIQKNFVSLVERTDLDVMVSALYEKGVFSEQMIEPYNNTNKDARTRKRFLYSDITRRGPRAFGHLLDALSEAGYWDLVRELDPHSALHFRPRSPISLKSDESNFVSIRNERQKTKNGVDTNKNPVKDTPTPRDVMDLSDPLEIPKFNVVKSTKFFEETGKDLQLYRTRGWNRGHLVVFSYIQFDNNTDERRAGADVDCKNLKYLFAELGMKVASYQNLTKKETLETLRMLQDGCVSDGECLFIVVSSHGYERRGSSDVDVRCSDGGIVSIYDFIGNFNDKNFPALRGIPKVFIFQLCRGSNGEWMGSGVSSDGTGRPPAPAPRAPPQLVELPRPQRDRVYNDILVAHSTLPGHVSHRDPVEGSWYIQALCEVFAARAHDCHVEKLFMLVDTTLHQRFYVQTSVTENWGFSRRLYLHPGLHEGPPTSACT